MGAGGVALLSRVEGCEQVQFLGRGRDVFVAQPRRPADGVVIARGVVTSLAEFFKLAVDDVIALGFHALVGVAHRRDMVREIPHSQHHVKFGSAVHRIEGLIQLGRHGPPAPTVGDGGGDEIRVRHSEFTSHQAARAFAIHIDAAGVDGISFFRPCEQLLDWHEIGRPSPPRGLCARMARST
jgi:hypothetical protein